MILHIDSIKTLLYNVETNFNKQIGNLNKFCFFETDTKYKENHKLFYKYYFLPKTNSYVFYL